jgi:hypothetical protein
MRNASGARMVPLVSDLRGKTLDCFGIAGELLEKFIGSAAGRKRGTKEAYQRYN